MSVSISLTGQLQITDSRSNDLGTTKDTVNQDFSDELADGISLDQCDAVWRSRRTLNTTNETLDLRGGLTDAFGVAVSFAILKVVYIKVRTTTPGITLTVGGATNAVPLFGAANDVAPVGPNGILLRWEPSAAGIAIAAGSTDELKLTSSANLEYDIVLAGVKP